MLDTIKKYSRSINRILLFMAAIALVVYIFPRQGKFQYEYAKGKPWRHATLIAPFDFPVHKTQAELRIERENALKNFKPYFSYQYNLHDDFINTFEREYTSEKAKLRSKYPFLSDPLPGNADFDLFSGLRAHTKKILLNVFEKGIISLPEEHQDKPSSMVIMVIKNNFAEPHELGEFYTYQQAYSHLSTELTKYLNQRSTTPPGTIDRFISDLQLNRYLESIFFRLLSVLFPLLQRTIP